MLRACSQVAKQCVWSEGTRFSEPRGRNGAGKQPRCAVAGGTGRRPSAPAEGRSQGVRTPGGLGPCAPPPPSGAGPLPAWYLGGGSRVGGAALPPETCTLSSSWAPRPLLRVSPGGTVAAEPQASRLCSRQGEGKQGPGVCEPHRLPSAREDPARTLRDAPRRRVWAACLLGSLGVCHRATLFPSVVP